MSRTQLDRRQRVLAAIRHEPVDRLLTDIWATEEVWAKLTAPEMTHYLVDRLSAFFNKSTGAASRHCAVSWTSRR